MWVREVSREKHVTLKFKLKVTLRESKVLLTIMKPCVPPKENINGGQWVR